MKVPEGWHMNTVGDLFDVQLGKMLNKDAKKKHPQVPYLTNFNVRWGVFDLRQLNTMYFSERDKEKFSLKYGDLIMCEGGEVGRCAIWKDQMQPCFYQKALHRLRPKKDILPDFFQSYMSYVAGTKLLDDLTGKTSIAHLTKEKLVELPVRVPPFSEQKKIAGILYTWDRAIEVTEKLLNNSQQQKKALMQQLLTGKKRLPGFSREWERSILSQIADVIMGSSPKSEAYNDDNDGLPLLQGNADIKKRLSSPRIFTSQITRECRLGDILLSVRAPVGEISRSIHHACIGRGIAAIRAKSNISQDFIYQWLLYYEPKWERLSQGSTFESVNSSDIKSIYIEVPPIQEQQKIASILSIADKEIEILEQKLGCLRQEKKALMQQLLTGKRRVLINR